VNGVAVPIHDNYKLEWTQDRFVRITNPGNAPIQVQPPVLEPIGMLTQAGQPTGQVFPWIYSVRRHAGGFPRLDQITGNGESRSLAAGESLDFGLFQIGMLAVTKVSAAAPPQAREGDSLKVPVLIRFGTDSLRFILKTKIARTAIPGSFMPSMLICDRDTVSGVSPQHWDDDQEWKRASYVRVWNRGTYQAKIDSIRFPADSVYYAGSQVAHPMDKLFATRTYAGGVKVNTVWGGELKRFPVILNPGDSADFGLFEIGTIGLLVKQSAAQPRYRVGDTISVPVTLAGGLWQEVTFILKARVSNASAGSAIAPPADIAGKGNRARPVFADGRVDFDGGNAIRIRFSAPARGTASRSR
jgi:hypothetical protein